MPQSTLTKITLSVDAQLWQAFRIACIECKTSASKQSAVLMQEWLATRRKAQQAQREQHNE
jgi:hypothetical protein